MQTFRQKIIVTAWIVFCLRSLFIYAQWVHLDPEPGGRDGVTKYEKRFEPLAKTLPPFFRLNYLSETGRPDVSPAEEIARYYIAQYALAPSFLDRTAPHRYAVGDFLGTPETIRQEIPEAWTILQDFGGGVLLLKRKNR